VAGELTEILGVRELMAAFGKAAEAVEVTATQIVKRGQALVEGEAKKQFTGAHARGTPTTSRPGSPPDVVTGTLRRSIVSDSPQRDGLGVTGRVYPTAVYARIQELGGQTRRGTLPARPYMAPALKSATPRLSAIAAEEWGSALSLG
jgi:phage gpG-like protein